MLSVFSCECFLAYWYHARSQKPSSSIPHTERKGFDLLCCKGTTVWPERLGSVNCKYFLSCHLVETLLPKVVSGVLLQQPGHTQAVLGNSFIPFLLTGSPVLISITLQSSGSVFLNRSPPH